MKLGDRKYLRFVFRVGSAGATLNKSNGATQTKRWRTECEDIAKIIGVNATGKLHSAARWQEFLDYMRGPTILAETLERSLSGVGFHRGLHFVYIRRSGSVITSKMSNARTPKKIFFVRRSKVYWRTQNA